MDVDIPVLRALVTIADEGTISGAARRLYISQPALSGQVRRLERAVGAALFQRRADGVRLTAAGRAFLPYAERILADLQHGMAQAAAAVGQGVLRLDVLDAGLAVPRRVVARLHQRLPRVTMDVTERGSAEQVRRLRDGDCDLALTGASARPAGMNDTPLLDEPLGVALPATHPLAGRAQVRLTQLADDTHYLPRDTFAPEWVALVLDACRNAGFAPRTLPLRTESSLTPLHLVAAGECVAISLLSTPVPGEVAMRPLADAPAHRWMLRTRRGGTDGPLTAAALTALHGLR